MPSSKAASPDPAAAQPRAASPQAFTCPRCGAAMAFEPARSALACAACGHDRPLPPPTPDAQAQALREQDYLEALRRLAAREPSLEARVVDCPSCGAQTRFEGHVVGDACAFCAGALLLDQAHVERLIKPQAVLPFAVDKAAAQQVFARWVGSRWFAPNALKRTVSRADGVKGVYMPWWTYDAATATTYMGQRGTRRHVADQHPGASARAGSSTHVETTWEPVSGAVSVAFDDILVVGSPSIPAHLARVLQEDMSTLVVNAITAARSPERMGPSYVIRQLRSQCEDLARVGETPEDISLKVLSARHIPRQRQYAHGAVWSTTFQQRTRRVQQQVVFAGRTGDEANGLVNKSVRRKRPDDVVHERSLFAARIVPQQQRNVIGNLFDRRNARGLRTCRRAPHEREYDASLPGESEQVRPMFFQGASEHNAC